MGNKAVGGRGELDVGIPTPASSSSTTPSMNKKSISNANSQQQQQPHQVDWNKVRVLLSKLESTFKLNSSSSSILTINNNNSNSNSSSSNSSTLPSTTTANTNASNNTAASAAAAPLSSSASSSPSVNVMNTNASNNTVHYLLLRTDTTTPLITSTNWNDLDLNQTDSQYIFAKLQLAARQLAATLQSSATATLMSSDQSPSPSPSPSTAPHAQAIHMRGLKHVFSYYALGEYSLIVHREEAAPNALLGSLDLNPNLNLNPSTPMESHQHHYHGMEWSSAAASASDNNTMTMICNDGSVDFDKEAVLKSILQQLYLSLNGESEYGSHSLVTPSATAASASASSPALSVT